MSRILFIDLFSLKYEFLEKNTDKHGVYLASSLYKKHENSIVLAKGAFSSFLPGINTCYFLYYDKFYDRPTVSLIKGKTASYLTSLNIDAVVFKGEFPGDNIYKIDIFEDKVVFIKVNEIFYYDYIKLKNLIKNYNDKSILFSTSINYNIFSSLFSDEDFVFNSGGLGAEFFKKRIKMVFFNKGKHNEKNIFKKYYLRIIKLFDEERENNKKGESCFYCSKKCFSSEYFNINIKNDYVFDKYFEKCDFLKIKKESFYKLKYLFDIFGNDYLKVMPVLYFAMKKEILEEEIGFSFSEKLGFKDFTNFLKNLNVENNKFYNLLREDFELFKKEYGFDLKKDGNFYFPFENEELKNVNSMDFLPYISEKEKVFSMRKAFYDYAGICERLYGIYDEYWISNLMESVSPEYKDIDETEKFMKKLLNEKNAFFNLSAEDKNA
jgi:hypothetical protein